METIENLKRKLTRERAARKQAEEILEHKALELFETNIKLKELNSDLENEIQSRTEALKISERKYRDIVEKADDLIYNINSEGKINYVNQVCLSKLQYTEKELRSFSFTKLIREDYKSKVLNYYQTIVEDKKEYSYFEFPILTKNGQTVWIGQHLRKSINQENGSYEFTAMSRDITRQKIAEAELILAKNTIQKSEKKFKSIIENMDLGLIEINTEEEITNVNALFASMLEYSQKELRGKNIREIIMPDTMTRYEENLSIRKTGHSSVYELAYKSKSGKRIDAIASGSPFYDLYGTMLGSMALIYDTTQRKQKDRELAEAKRIAEEAQQAEAQFLASMSHEIRTPLNAIVGMSHLLLDTNPNQEQFEYIEILKSSSKILQGLISDILDLSKIDAGSLELSLLPFNLTETIESLITTFQVKTADKNISVKKNLQFDADQLLVGDEMLINQVLLNLLGNAEKFTSEGEITVNIKSTNSTDSKLRLNFEVKDTGIGISSDKIDHIFDRFKQADITTRVNYGGTGLGLPICKKLVEIMGGEIKVSSELGKGSSFSFEIEFEKGEKILNYKKLGLNQMVDNYQFIDHPILIAEDNLVNQKYITRLFDKWNIIYDIANDGKEAVELSNTKKYQIIFMDLQMPEMDGYEAAEIITTTSNKNQKTPIVALTASSLLSMKESAFRSGMVGYLTKPFNPKELSKLINELITPDCKTNSNQQMAFMDLEILEDMYGDDHEYASDMFETFLKMINKELPQLDEAIRMNVNDDVRKISHKLKPTFSMVGLPSLTEDFEKLEMAAKEEEELSQVYQSIKSSLPSSIEQIKKHAKKLKTLI